MVRSNKKKTALSILILLVIILVGFLTFYQFFYKSKRVDSGIAKLQSVFTGHQGIVTGVRFDRGDSLIISGSVDSTIKLWEPTSGRLVHQINHPGGISYLDLNKDAQYIVTGSYDRKVRLWNTNGTLLKEFAGHQGTVWTVAFSDDATKIASSGDDAEIRIWDIASGQLLRTLKGHDRIVWSVKFSPDGTMLASASFDFTVKLWNVADGKVLWDNRQHTETVVDLAFSHDGRILASTSDDKTIKLWNVNEKSLIRTMKVAEHVQAAAFSPDDTRLMTGGRDKPMIGEFLQNFLGDSKMNKGVSARLWDVKSGKLLQTFTSHANDVMDVAYSHNGKLIATASADKTVEVWRIDDR